jgi:GT2 family glycosyltransferase
MTNPSVLISVLNWNDSDSTLRCLDALSRLAYTPYHVVIVDNASTDGSISRIRAAYPDVEMICSNANQGYAGGNMLAMMAALRENVDLFWILNPDALVELDTLSYLVDAYIRHGDALYGSVPLYRVNESDAWRVKLQTWALDADGQPDIRRRHIIDGLYPDGLPTREDIPLASLHGSSLMIPMSVIRQHGFIDTSFFMYAEETDYALRLGKLGISSFLVSSSVVYHSPQGAHKHHPELKPVITYYQTRSRLVLTRRHDTPVAYIKALALHFAYAVAWAIASLTKGRIALHISKFTLLGILDAVRGRMGKTYAPERYLVSRETDR